MPKGECFHAHRANRPVDRGHSAQALWRNGTGNLLADRGAGRARARCHAVRQRRFHHVRQAQAGMAPSAAARWGRSRPLCPAYDDAGAGPPAGGRLRLPAFPSRLLPVLAVLPAAHAVRDDLAWTPRPAGASADVLDLLVHPCGLDLRCAAPAGAACRMGPHRPSRSARAAPDAAAGEAQLSRLHRPHLTGESDGSRDRHCGALWAADQDRC
jgi:hypothetical protein